jgi:hypothetical protein
VRVAGGEPVQQGDDRFEVLLGGDELAVGSVRAVQPAAEPADHVPDGVAMQELLLAGLRSRR